MMRWIAAMLFLAACGDDTVHRQAPPGGPGGAVGSGGAGGVAGTAGSGGTGGSAGLDAASTTLAGHVCTITTGIGQQDCTQGIATGSTVSIAGTATSVDLAADGSFSIDATGLSTAVLLLAPAARFWRAAMQVDVPAFTIPLRTIDVNFQTDLYAQSNVTVQAPRLGFAMIYAVSSSGAPVSGVAVQDAPRGQELWYDSPSGGNVLTNTGTATAGQGFVLFPNVPVGTLSFTLVPPAASGPAVPVAIPIVSDAVSIVHVVVVP